MSKKFHIDYTNFNPDKEYLINNDKIHLSHDQIIYYGSDFFKENCKKGGQEALKKLIMMNPDHQSHAASIGGPIGGKVSAEKYNGKFLVSWQLENPEEFQTKSALGGHIQGTINKEKGLGIFGQTEEERSENGRKNSKVFWDNATEEEKEERANKASESMKNLIAENGYWNPHQYITDDLRKTMAANMINTKLKQREQRIKELYDKIDTNDWFDLPYATKVLQSYSGKGASQGTARRMVLGWKEASIYFESVKKGNSIKFRKK